MISSKALECSHFHVNSVSSVTSCFSIISWTLYEVVDHRAISLLQGRCCRNLQLTLLCSFVAGETIARIIPHRPRLVTLQDSKVRHPTPLFSYHVRISHNLARRLPFETDTVGNM